nr:biopolymer transporter Tol [Bdellovibrionales bacterium]
MLHNVALAFLSLLWLGCSSTPKPPPAPAAAPPQFVTNPKPFTLTGRRAGEGYFSRDGRYVIYQSESQDGNPFYQIYVRDLRTGATKRVSNGQGKTTCAWIHPDNKKVLFASTHQDPRLKEKIAEELKDREQPKHRYSWSFDDTYDIYETGIGGGALKNLTRSPGYDAEGSYSPDGKWIAFASNRRGYTEKLDPETKALFDKDPSVLMDIYIMPA